MDMKEAVVATFREYLLPELEDHEVREIKQRLAA